MSRVFQYLSCEKGKTGGFYYSSYYTFFEALGLKPKNYGEIRVHGCGMDMNFSTCYDIAHSLKKMKIITKERCEKLAQTTPTCV
ncbi:hypothetical protein EOM81_13305 [bacterium]|nr:hypothetical protein [bacterium]